MFAHGRVREGGGATAVVDNCHEAKPDEHWRKYLLRPFLT